MSKERLEEIKEHVKWTVENGLQPRVEDSDLEWLINRVEELEVWYHSYHKEAKLNNILKIQNKRYREALEFYADEENYKPFDGIFLSRYQNKIDEDGGEKARKALEGEK